MNIRRMTLAVAVAAATLLPAQANAIPLAGLVLTVDQVCPDVQCGYVTAELVRSYSTGQPEDTRGVFECTAVVPGATRVVISCTFGDITATDVSGLPVVAVAVGTIGGSGGPDGGAVCLSLSADMATYVQTYNKCYDVIDIGQ